jgi:hypothetical protein
MPDDHSTNAGSVRPLNPATATFSTSTKVIQQTSLTISSTPAKSMATPPATQQVTVTMTAGAYTQPAWQISGDAHHIQELRILVKRVKAWQHLQHQ